MKNNLQLAPDQIERLAVLVEEMGESLQVIGKILRHGYESKNPDIEDSETNRQMLEKELGDVRCAVTLMTSERDVSAIKITNRADAKIISIQKWLHHQKQKE